MFIAPSDKNYFFMSDKLDNFRKHVLLFDDPAKKSENDAYFDSLWSDEQYRQAIEQYRNEPWFDESVLMSNPHLRSKQARFTTDPLTGLFNYKGAAATYYGNMRSDAMNWLDERTKQLREEWYNSPVNQVQREAAAGINSALSPDSISPGEAAQNDNPIPASYHNGTSESGMHIANAGLSFIGNILSFAKEIQSLNIGKASKVSAELGASSSARDMVLTELSHVYEDNPESFKDFDSLSKVVSNLRLFRGYSRDTRKFLEHYLQRYNENETMGLDALVAELRNRIVSANRDTAETMSSPYYSKDLNEWIGKLGEGLTKYQAAAERYHAAVAASKGEVENVYWNGSSKSNNQNQYGNTIAAEMNEREDSARSRSEIAKWKHEMNSSWNAIETEVKGNGDKWYNTIGTILLQFLRAQVIGDM